MFTTENAIDLLTCISAYDGRKPSEGQALAWREAGQRGRWAIDDALEAVHGHFAVSRQWIMPADVNDRVRAIRSERARVTAERAELERGREVSTVGRDRVAQIVSEIAAKLGIPSDPDHDEARRMIGCPHCHAILGERCKNPRTGKPLRESAGHPARIDAMDRAKSG